MQGETGWGEGSFWMGRADRKRHRRGARLFRWLPRLPGTASNGSEADLSLAWTNAILSVADQHDRRGAADSLLGKVLGSAGFLGDGAPTDERTQLLERVRCLGIERGLAMAVGNKLGTVPPSDDEAGRPYRTRAESYRELAERYRDSAQRTARVVRQLRGRSREQSGWADDRRQFAERLDAS